MLRRPKNQPKIFLSYFSCLLSPIDGLLFAFFGPAAVIICCHALMVPLTWAKYFGKRVEYLKYILYTKVMRYPPFLPKEALFKNLPIFRGGVKFLLVSMTFLGLTWAFGYFVMANWHGSVFGYLFAIFNGLEGAAFMIAILVLNDEVCMKWSIFENTLIFGFFYK